MCRGGGILCGLDLGEIFYNPVISIFISGVRMSNWCKRNVIMIVFDKIKAYQLNKNVYIYWKPTPDNNDKAECIANDLIRYII